jgi:murein tripeptide amidase MpaA
MITQQCLVTIVTLFCVGWLSGKSHAVEFEYHNFRDLEAFLINVSQTFPHIAHLYSIGTSVQCRDLWVIALGNIPDEHVPLRPEVKYVGNIHGNEVTGREILIHLIDLLVNGYGTNSTITDMLDSMRIHILVSVNPDGFENATQHHNHGECSGLCEGTMRMVMI